LHVKVTNYIISVQKACSLVWNKQVMALLTRTVKCVVSVPVTGYSVICLAMLE